MYLLCFFPEHNRHIVNNNNRLFGLTFNQFMQLIKQICRNVIYIDPFFCYKTLIRNSD